MITREANVKHPSNSPLPGVFTGGCVVTSSVKISCLGQVELVFIWAVKLLRTPWTLSFPSPGGEAMHLPRPNTH